MAHQFRGGPRCGRVGGCPQAGPSADTGSRPRRGMPRGVVPSRDRFQARPRRGHRSQPRCGMPDRPTPPPPGARFCGAAASRPSPVEGTGPVPVAGCPPDPARRGPPGARFCRGARIRTEPWASRRIDTIAVGQTEAPVQPACTRLALLAGAFDGRAVFGTFQTHESGVHKKVSIFKTPHKRRCCRWSAAGTGRRTGGPLRWFPPADGPRGRGSHGFPPGCVSW